VRFSPVRRQASPAAGSPLAAGTSPAAGVPRNAIPICCVFSALLRIAFLRYEAASDIPAARQKIAFLRAEAVSEAHRRAR